MAGIFLRQISKSLQSFQLGNPAPTPSSSSWETEMDGGRKEELIEKPTAFNSPKFPPLAKCPLKLAFALPADTPQRLLSTLPPASTATLTLLLVKNGERQSSSMAKSLKTSAARRYRLHSGSRARPRRAAKRMVARRERQSRMIVWRRAVVGVAVGSPTPTPVGEMKERQLAKRYWAFGDGGWGGSCSGWGV